MLKANLARPPTPGEEARFLFSAPAWVPIRSSVNAEGDAGRAERAAELLARLARTRLAVRAVDTALERPGLTTEQALALFQQGRVARDALELLVEASHRLAPPRRH